MNEEEKRTASFTRLGNDLYWSCYINGSVCRWTGYDDYFWWQTVATTDQFQVREHEGKQYKLDPKTRVVTRTSKASTNNQSTNYDQRIQNYSVYRSGQPRNG